MIEQASFRGVPFAIASATDALGRRVATHEFISRDDPFVEDMGKAPRIIKISAFVASNDWRAERDALQTALDEAGPGTLVHPWYGSVTVSLRSASVGHTGSASNMATFDLEFVRVAEISGPTPMINAAAVVQSRANVAADNAACRFVSRLNVEAVGDFVLASLQSDFSGALTSLESITGVSLSSVASWVDDFAGDGGYYLYNAVIAGDLAGDIVSLYSSISAKNTNPSSMLNVAKTTPAVEWPKNAGVARQYAAANSMAVADMQREMAIIECLRLVGTWTPTSSTEATVLRSSVLDVVDDILFDMHDAPTRSSADLAHDVDASNTYDSIMSLRAAALTALAVAAKQSPDVFTVPHNMHAQLNNALALVYKMTGSVDTESDFVTRNTIVNPAVVPAGQKLEVLRA